MASGGAGEAIQVPFELRVLEVVLDFITLFLEFLVTGLEKLARPILDAIVQKALHKPLSSSYQSKIAVPVTVANSCKTDCQTASHPLRPECIQPEASGI